MPRASEEELRKVTLNLYEADCAYLQHAHGFGWTGEIRRLVNDYVKLHKPTEDNFDQYMGNPFTWPEGR